MKVLFLDIDGIVCIPSKIKGEGWKINDDCQDILGKILEQTEAKIVISSSWRQVDTDSTIKYLTKEGFRFGDLVIDQTIRADLQICGEYINIPRGVEINHWLNKTNRKIDSYLILDDNGDMLLGQKNNFIQTDIKLGLQEEHIELAINILNKNKL